MSADSSPRLRRWSSAQDRRHPELSQDASRARLVPAGPGAWSAFLALSDGAGSTPYAGEWAKALVAAAEPHWLDGGLADGIDKVRQVFDPRTEHPSSRELVLQSRWLERGSSATLVLAAVVLQRDRVWCSVSAIGDTIAMVSQPDAFESFPIRTSAEFSNRTTAVNTAFPELEVSSCTWNLRPGSMLALASDAMGAWLLRHCERDGPASVFSWLGALSEDDALPEVEDDATLLVLDVPAGPGRADRVVQRMRRASAGFSSPGA